MASDKTYNGYTNYETWNIMLWLYNDENNYYELRSRMRPYGDGFLPDEKDVREMCEAIFSVGDDLLAISTPDRVWLDDRNIDWDQIRSGLIEDFDLSETNDSATQSN